VKPKITCVMVTGKSPARRRLAQVAIESFRRQNYANRELLILSTAPEPWLEGGDDGRIREILVRDPQTPLGALRNLAFEHGTGEYLLQWDDDDFHGSRRIRHQVQALSENAPANILTREIIDFGVHDKIGAVVFSPTHWRSGGFPGSILHPIDVKTRYPETRKGEDTDFLSMLRGELKLLGHSIEALQNDPRDYVRFVHGANTWDRGHFEKWLSQSRPLEKWETTHLENVRWFVRNSRRLTGAGGIQESEIPGADRDLLGPGYFPRADDRSRFGPTPEEAAVAINRAIAPVPWMRERMGWRLQQIIREHGLKNILEIGTLHGAGTTHLAAAAAAIDGYVTTIDLPASRCNTPRVEDLLHVTGLAEHVDVVRHADGAAGWFLERPPTAVLFDLVYIDGDHTFDGAARDAAIALQLLRPGGWLVMDDVQNDAHPAVWDVWRSLVRRDPRLAEHELWGQWGICRRVTSP
jgi:predicted O-methyltransferase YrrM